MPFGDVKEPSLRKCKCMAKTDELSRKWTQERRTAVEVLDTAASLGERQARRRGNNTARGKQHRQRQRHHIRSRASASVEISEGRFPREGPSESHNGQSQSLKPEQKWDMWREQPTAADEADSS